MTFFKDTITTNTIQTKGVNFFHENGWIYDKSSLLLKLFNSVAGNYFRQRAKLKSNFPIQSWKLAIADWMCPRAVCWFKYILRYFRMSLWGLNNREKTTVYQIRKTLKSFWIWLNFFKVIQQQTWRSCLRLAHRICNFSSCLTKFSEAFSSIRKSWKFTLSSIFICFSFCNWDRKSLTSSSRSDF